MKLVEIIRGGNPYPWKLANGDQYDSILNIYDGFVDHNTVSGLTLIDTIPFVSTVPSVGVQAKSGKLAAGNYFFIVGTHKDKYTALNLVNKIPVPADHTQLDDDIQTLPSAIPNPNHDGKMIIEAVHVHRGDYGLSGPDSWSWSEGCMTVVYGDGIYAYWDKFIAYFKLNEVGGFRLVEKK